MSPKITLLLGCMLLAGSALADCPNRTASNIGARYQITTSFAGSAEVQQRVMTLWRERGKAAHQYADAGMTEVWEQMTNGRLRMVRYFDAHQRGIEYEPKDMSGPSDTTDWSLKAQLVSDQLIASMRRVAANTQGCEPVEFLSADINHKQVQLEWLPQSKLVRKYMEISAGGIIKWELQEVISDQQQVNNFFASRAGFYTTDYADVGDNESDPFLLGMINLGFIEHGSSGFYDEHGHAIGKGHPH